MSSDNNRNVITVNKECWPTRSTCMDRRTTAQFMGVSEKFLAIDLADGPKRLCVGPKVLYRLEDVERWRRQQEVIR